MGGLHAFAPTPRIESTFCFRMQMQMQEVSGLALRATSHTRLRAHDHYTSSTPIGGKKAEPVQVRFTLCLRDQWSK